ncbi:MAG TPA: Smr/MutS family protein, partial [Gemmatimonadaceae bacterium]|nr:Smr/MutS family protein [Gemmatimonadaceae bacterium]
YGLGIARRLRLPDEILARAEERLPRGERDVAALLATLELREAELEERELEKRSRQEAREYLLEARREVERVIKHLRKAPEGATDDALRDARRRVEELAETQAAALDELEQRERAERSRTRKHAEPAPPPLAEGDHVEVATLGGRVGQIVALRDDSATVVVGGMKLTVRRAALGRKRAPERAVETAVPMYGDMPDVHAPSEVDLRGMRVDEIDGVVMHALDSAIRADLKSLRIIHGKGTGALRDRVAEMLRGDGRIRSFRLGAWNEGGAGVTVAELA